MTPARDRRLALGLTQAEVAARAHLSREQYGRIEVGGVDSRISTLRAIARALDCPLVELFEVERRPGEPSGSS